MYQCKKYNHDKITPQQSIYVSKTRDINDKKITKMTNKDMTMLEPGINELNSYSTWIDNNNIEYIKIPICNYGTEEYQAKKSLEITKRVVLESKYTDNNYFITFTYNDNTVPKQNGINTLRKNDIKKVRNAMNMNVTRHTPYKPKFCIAGEYGTKTERPHYHMIALNYKNNDFIPIKDSKPLQYSSKYLTKLWNKGNIQIQECNEATIAYTANYCLKKLKKKKDYIDKEPEFILISKQMGWKYLEEHKQDLLNNNKIKIGNATHNIPTSFEKVLYKDKENIIQLDKNKENNLLNKRYKDHDNIKQYPKNYDDYDIREAKQNYKNIMEQAKKQRKL